MDSAHFTVRASGEIYLAFNGSSVTVQLSTRKTKYDLKLISDCSADQCCSGRAHVIFLRLCRFR